MKKKEEPIKREKKLKSGPPLLKRPAGMPKILFREIAKFLAEDLRNPKKSDSGE